MENKRYIEVANELNLFCLGDSAGVVYWKPKGMHLYNQLKSFIQQQHKEAGYLEVKSPSLVVSQLFEKSGHISKYKDNMFFMKNEEQVEYALRPMSCPNHIVIYQSEKRSYQQLPLKFFEFGEVFRNESSGSLQLLFRQRQFCQDDSHVFVSEEKLIDSLNQFIHLSQKVYKLLGFDEIQYAISLRPEKRFGNDLLWDKAENALRLACQNNELKYLEVPNDGAFYGPKLELQVRDKLGRLWQLGVIQLDYVLPERFDLHYIDKNNQSVRPILLHHAVLGSLERMIGILLESFGVHLPEFLHPYPSVVLPISEKSHEYAHLIAQKLQAAVDDSHEPFSKKIAIWKSKGVPNIYVVGEKEFLHYQQHHEMKAVLNKKEHKEIIVLQ